MAKELISSCLSDQQQGQVCGILSVGCDRQTAADYVGCTLAAIRRTMQQDDEFRADVCRAEAGVELSHMRNVHVMAAGEKKDWRASVWWLERRSPERFAKRPPGSVTPRQLKAFVALVCDVLTAEVHHRADRDRVITRVSALADSAEQMLSDAQPGWQASRTAFLDLVTAGVIDEVDHDSDADMDEESELQLGDAATQPEV